MLKPYLGGSSNLVKQVAGFNGVVSEPKELGPVCIKGERINWPTDKLLSSG